MKIPRLHYISQGKTTKEHLENIRNVCIAGAELVQLRLKNLHHKEILKTAKEARRITERYHVLLIINDYYKIAKEVKADGVHLGKNDVSPSVARKFLGQYYIIGGTANTLEDCKNLTHKKVSYIGLGPYRFTNTKDNLSPTIGYIGYLTILEELKTNTPIIAIGGITLSDVRKLMETSIYGIAVSSEITKNFNTIKRFNKLLQPLSLQKEI